MDSLATLDDPRDLTDADFIPDPSEHTCDSVIAGHLDR